MKWNGEEYGLFRTLVFESISKELFEEGYSKIKIKKCNHSQDGLIYEFTSASEDNND
jgi:hypothetical protein